MCGGFSSNGSTSSNKPDTLAEEWIHVCRPATGMPNVIPNYSAEEIECAFPDLFELLTATMFLNPAGYSGAVDDDRKPSPGSWYGLSWGTIHRDTLYIWRPFATSVRLRFWSGFWKWIFSLGRTPIIEAGLGSATALAFIEPLPINLFERAVIRLHRAGMLSRQVEELEGKRFPMYYPTIQMSRKLERARYELRMEE